MHAYRFNGNEPAELCQVLFKKPYSLVIISVCHREIFIVVSDFMAKGMDSPDDNLIKALRVSPEVVCTGNAEFFFQFCTFQGVGWPGIDIVSQDDTFINRMAEESGYSHKCVTL